MGWLFDIWVGLLSCTRASARLFTSRRIHHSTAAMAKAKNPHKGSKKAVKSGVGDDSDAERHKMYADRTEPKETGEPQTFLNYERSKVGVHDVDCVKSNEGWYTDAIITFWIDFLLRTRLGRDPNDLQGHPIMFVDPTVAFTLRMTKSPRPAQWESFMGPRATFLRADYIFLPVSDNADVTQSGGGSHWSLLVIDRSAQRAYHYDNTLTAINEEDARAMADRMGRFIRAPLAFHQSDRTPKTYNTFDCGAYVCVMMKHLLMRLLHSREHMIGPNGIKSALNLDDLDINARVARETMVIIMEELQAGR